MRSIRSIAACISADDRRDRSRAAAAPRCRSRSRRADCGSRGPRRPRAGRSRPASRPAPCGSARRAAPPPWPGTARPARRAPWSSYVGRAAPGSRPGASASASSASRPQGPDHQPVHQGGAEQHEDHRAADPERHQRPPGARRRSPPSKSAVFSPTRITAADVTNPRLTSSSSRSERRAARPQGAGSSVQRPAIALAPGSHASDSASQPVADVDPRRSGGAAGATEPLVMRRLSSAAAGDQPQPTSHGCRWSPRRADARAERHR